MFISKTFLRAVLGFSAAILFGMSAMAQSTILVVDTGRVLRDSDVGKHIKRQLETIGKSIEAEAKAKTNPLETKSKSLQAQLKGQTRESLMGNSALQAQIKNFQQDQQAVKLDLAYKQKEMEITEGKAVQKVQEHLRGILKTIVAERNADVVLERSLVIYGDPADITDTVISRLNRQLKTVPVLRERLPRQPLNSGK